MEDSQQLVMSGTHTDGCTYTNHWTHCFTAATVQAAKEELDRLHFVALEAGDTSFTFFGMEFWCNEEEVESVRIQTLQEWFSENEVRA